MCACSLLYIVLYTRIGESLYLSPLYFLWLFTRIYVVFGALSSWFWTMWICPLLMLLTVYICSVWHVSSFSVAASCTVVYVMLLILGSFLCWVFGVVALECGCEGDFGAIRYHTCNNIFLLTLHLPSYLQIHWPNRHPTKFSLTKAHKMMMRSQHHHAA